MNLRLLGLLTMTSALAIASAGCDNAPGKPKPGLTAETRRPDQVTDFETLYGQNCAACHGDHGKNGAAISLANPVYLAYADAQNLQRITAVGVPRTMMPAFAKSAGGMLTDQQITVLTQGMIRAWEDPPSGPSSLPTSSSTAAQSLPPYGITLAADTGRGQEVFSTYCASCHGANATGKELLGSLVDPAYLSLVSDQGLRSIVVAGKTDTAPRSQPMPDYRSYPKHSLTAQEITDVVAWLASHRTATPGQIYPQHQ